MKKRIFLGLLALWILGSLFQKVKESVHRQDIINQSIEYVESLPVEYVHEVKGDCSLRDTFLEELLSLGEWSQKNWALIEDPKESGERWEDLRDWYLYEQEVNKKLKSIRQKLEAERRTRLNDIFSGGAEAFGIEKAGVLSCMEAQRFDLALTMVQCLEEGKGQQAFEEGIKLVRWYSNPVLLDIGFMFYPEVLKQGCEEALQQVISSPMDDDSSRVVSMAQEFSTRYGVTLDHMEEALRKKASYEFELLPETPYVGMDISELYDTKLGSPSKMEHKSQRRNGKTYEYGYIYWYSQGKTIFRAYYYGDEIIEVRDRRENRNRSSSGNTSNRSMIYRGRGSIDPEDHDIEAYYEDNMDEYDDYDDAYDGFLDEEGEWDDY